MSTRSEAKPARKVAKLIVGFSCAVVTGLTSACGAGPNAESTLSAPPGGPDAIQTGQASQEPKKTLTAADCPLSIEDLTALPPPIPRTFTRVEVGGYGRLECRYIGNIGLRLEKVSYGSYVGLSKGDGYVGEALARTCADGSRGTDVFDISSLDSAQRAMESYISCETERFTNTIGIEQRASRRLDQVLVRRDIGQGLYCHIPSNCYLLTDAFVYHINWSRFGDSSFAERNASPFSGGFTDEAFEPFGGFAGAIAVAKLILQKD